MNCKLNLASRHDTQINTYSDILSKALDWLSVRGVGERTRAVVCRGAVRALRACASEGKRHRICAIQVHTQYQSGRAPRDKKVLYVQDMVPILRLRLKRKVRSVLHRSVVPQRELDRTAVHAGAQAVGTVEPVEPGDASVELALDRAGAARVGMALV